jgi:hypothetical protein
MRPIAVWNAGTALLGVALFATGCSSRPEPGAAGTPRAATPPTSAGAPRAATPIPAPAPYSYPAPVKGHYKEINTGDFDLVDGIAYTAQGGTVVYVASQSIASPMLAGSTCPMTQARALTLLRNASYLEVTLDAKARSDYFASGSPYGGRGRETNVGGGYWKVAGGELKDGRIAGTVTYKGHGRFEFDLPVSKPGITEVSEGDRVQGVRAEAQAPAPSEAQILAAYAEVRRASLAKDLKALLSAQGFDEKQIAAIRGLADIDADLEAHADRFLEPGAPEEPSAQPGAGSVGASGVNSKGEKFTNYYQFASCGDKLVLVGIGLNPQ